VTCQHQHVKSEAEDRERNRRRRQEAYPVDRSGRQGGPARS
jgi:hypothetical protein